MVVNAKPYPLAFTSFLCFSVNDMCEHLDAFDMNKATDGQKAHENILNVANY